MGQKCDEAVILLDGFIVSYQGLVNGSYIRGNDHTVYDIGLKRDDWQTFKGHLRDLVIIGEALTAEEVRKLRLTGENKGNSI